MTNILTPTAVITCEACWTDPVEDVRVTAAGTDLLCRACAIGDYPRRVDLFPPFGVYGVKARVPDQGPRCRISRRCPLLRARRRSDP